MTQDVYLGRKALHLRVVEALEAAWSIGGQAEEEGGIGVSSLWLFAGLGSLGDPHPDDSCTICGPRGDRTHNPRIKSPLLCQLS